MTDDRRQQAAFLDIALRIQDAFRQPRNRHAGVRRDPGLAGGQRQRGEVGVMARLPQLVAFFGPVGPLKVAAAKLIGNRADLLGLFAHRRFGAVKFEPQSRFGLVTFELGIGDAGAHLKVVEQFDTGHRNARLYREDHGVYRVPKRGILADGGRYRLGNAV